MPAILPQPQPRRSLRYARCLGAIFGWLAPRQIPAPLISNAKASTETGTAGNPVVGSDEDVTLSALPVGGTELLPVLTPPEPPMPLERPAPIAVAVAVGAELWLADPLGEDVEVPDGAGDADGVAPPIAVGLGDTTAEHAEAVMVFVSKVTAPSLASSRPWNVALVWAVMDVWESTSPTKSVAVPNVAELPTCQTTLHACAPLINLTALLLAVISVEPAWKMNTAFGSPCASSVKVPVRPNVGLV